MADNFLERKMEEYRSRPKRPFSAVTPSQSVFIIDGLSSLGREEIIRRRTHPASYRVAFCAADYREGNRLAQATGSRFYPIDPSDPEKVNNAIADCKRLWGDLDNIIDCRQL